MDDSDVGANASTPQKPFPDSANLAKNALNSDLRSAQNATLVRTLQAQQLVQQEHLDLSTSLDIPTSPSPASSRASGRLSVEREEDSDAIEEGEEDPDNGEDQQLKQRGLEGLLTVGPPSDDYETRDNMHGELRGKAAEGEERPERMQEHGEAVVVFPPFPVENPKLFSNLNGCSPSPPLPTRLFLRTDRTHKEPRTIQKQEPNAMLMRMIEDVTAKARTPRGKRKIDSEKGDVELEQGEGQDVEDDDEVEATSRMVKRVRQMNQN